MLKIAGGIVLGFSILIFLFVPIFPAPKPSPHPNESMLYHFFNCD